MYVFKVTQASRIDIATSLWVSDPPDLSQLSTIPPATDKISKCEIWFC